MLLIHGARSILWHAKRMKQPDRLRAWALRLERKLGHNKAAVAPEESRYSLLGDAVILAPDR